jgi:hypothetical protein
MAPNSSSAIKKGDTDGLYRNHVMLMQAEEASGSATVVGTIVPTLATAGTLGLALTPRFSYLAACPSPPNSSGTDLMYYLFWIILPPPWIP